MAHKEEEEMEMKRKFSPREEDLVVGKVAKKSTRKMTDYDIHLRKFRYLYNNMRHLPTSFIWYIIWSFFKHVSNTFGINAQCFYLTEFLIYCMGIAKGFAFYRGYERFVIGLHCI